MSMNRNSAQNVIIKIKFQFIAHAQHSCSFTLIGILLNIFTRNDSNTCGHGTLFAHMTTNPFPINYSPYEANRALCNDQ